MNEPTEAQIKEFWEKCGLYYKDYSVLEAANSCEAMCMDRPISGWYDSKGKLVSFKTVPVVDFNNLFKYAVPKLQEKFSYTEYWELMDKWLDDTIEELGKPDYDKVCAQALFCAIKESL